MRLVRRTFLSITLAATSLGALPGALAQGYPSQPVRLIVPYAAG